MLWPKRYAATANSTGMKERPSWVRRLVVLEVDLRGPGRDFLVHRVGHGLPHDGGQELVGHDPLVVPPGQPPSRLEHGRPRQPACAQSVHQPVVELLHRHVELEDDLCLVVAGVRDDRSALGAAVGVVGRNAGHVVDHVGLHVPGLCFVDAVRPLELADDLAVRTLNDQELVTVVGVVELRVRRWDPARRWRRGRSGACGSWWWRRGRTAAR